MTRSNKKVNVSKENAEKIEAAKLRLKAMRESGAAEEFDDEISEEDVKYLLECRRKFANKKKNG